MECYEIGEYSDFPTKYIMRPITQMIAPDASPKKFCRIRLRSNSGSLTIQCRRSPVAAEVKRGESEFDSAFAELEPLSNYTDIERMNEDEFHLIHPDFSVFHFWMEHEEMENVSKMLENIECQGLPHIDDDYLSRTLGLSRLSLGTECREQENMQFQENSQAGFAYTQVADPTSSWEASVLEFLQNPTVQMISPPVMQTDAKLLSLQTEPISLENESSLPAYLGNEVRSLRESETKKIRLTSLRSKKRKRLNPAIVKGPLPFFPEPESSRDNVTEKLRCNEVLKDFDSDGSDVEYPGTVHKEGNISKLTKDLVEKQKPPSRRGNLLPAEGVEVLSRWMEVHISNPYASREEKKELALLSGLKLEQVDNWLSNQRYKLKLQKNKRNASATDEVNISNAKPHKKTADKNRRIF